MAGVRLQGNNLRLRASTFPRSDMPHLACHCTQETRGNSYSSLKRIFGNHLTASSTRLPIIGSLALTPKA